MSGLVKFATIGHVAALLGAATVAGCASTAPTAPTAGVETNVGPAARGLALAQTHCAACHAIGPGGSSPAAMAPPFRILRNRYNEISFERRLERLARDHTEMPRMNLGRSDIDAIAAYIDTLRLR